MPFGWGDSEDAYKQANDSQQEFHNESSFGHEALAGAASFGAFKIFEDRQRKEGKPVSHQFAKELLVGIAGAEVDKLIETKGMDFVDREKAKRHAKENVEHMYDEHYVREQGANEYDPNQYRPNNRLYDN
ncbi:uncharacterized protein BP5553_02999 [Venustampulla echinocandica]|uniref:CipC-like antibiotic response protein n=1 Tax=Venustampulla echinocandica TaxID=2656787 RepID=A0A370TT01_9HELO|nr:uncharacterized protein BP5553_02999 [Venustampulla echinocandica]RDL38659.1 hypothetical protein BP5553_02999 [Venustampulla echinocandica]